MLNDPEKKIKNRGLQPDAVRNAQTSQLVETQLF